MKNRFSTMSQTALGLCLLFSAGGLMFSCSDDYDLDDNKPSFLGGSIYDELEARGNFKYTLRLINDLDYADVLAKTGSKTIFAANDAAYEKFFAETTWTAADGTRVDSYDKLSLAQKKHLLNNAMLNNAYVLEMMANCPSGEKNLCLRQTSAASITDSVTFWHTYDLPLIQSENSDYPDFWHRFHQGTGDTEGAEGQAATGTPKMGIRMAVNNTTPMIVHFLEGQMLEKNITHDDVSFILNLEGDRKWTNDNPENRSYVYDARILPEGQDIVCMNGYIHEIDKVLVAPSNMAEVIRTNGLTNIFSHILDRFSAPYYDDDLTYNYKSLYDDGTDSVFVKRYFAVRTHSGQLLTDPNKSNVKSGYPYLSFDPSWNQFMSTESESAEKNMGAMFVPSDKVLADYFIHGGGKVLMERYATKENNEANLLYNIDQIPLDIIQALVNNLMKNSFNETVPSKYLSIMNDARDQMFPISDGYGNLDAYKAIFDKVMLANNGVVYVMNKVVAPADYSSVIAPVLYSNNAQVMRAVVRADESYIQGSQYANAPLQTYFSTYLKAMQSRFSLFVPTDDGLSTCGYVDPASLAAGNSRNYMYWRYAYKTGNVASTGKRLPIDAVAYTYNMEKGYDPADKARGNDYRSLYNDLLSSTYGEVKKKLLIEMVNQHIVVHEGNEDIRSGRKYFLSRTGAPVIIQDKGTGKGAGMKVRGGFQEQLSRQGLASAYNCTVKEENDVYDQSQETNGYGNGMTYFIDRPMQPTTNTVYKVVKSMPSTSKFMELCEGVNDDILKDAGLRDPYANSESKDAETKWQQAALLYYLFYQGEKGGAKFNVPSGDKLVRSFNNYRYTVYVPTDDAVEKEIQNGLPTWDTIEEFLDANLIRPEKPAGEPQRPTDVEADDYEDQVKEYERQLAEWKSTVEYKLYEADLAKDEVVKLQAQGMINTLVNFLKYHFQDESVFADNVASSGEYMTACISNGNYLNLHVAQSEGKIALTDAEGRTVNVSANGENTNLIARDAHYNTTTNPRLIESSSYVVVHQLDQALHFEKLTDGRWDNAWKSAKKAKAFLAKYGTQK